MVDPLGIIVIAYAVRRLPYVVRSVVAGLQQTSVTLDEAAQNLGASPLRALCRITLPLILANVLAGGLLAFSFAMLEVSDSLILAQRMQDFPITKAIFELYQLLGEGPFLACALGVWAMLFLGPPSLRRIFSSGKSSGECSGFSIRGRDPAPFHLPRHHFPSFSTARLMKSVLRFLIFVFILFGAVLLLYFTRTKSALPVERASASGGRRPVPCA